MELLIDVDTPESAPFQIPPGKQMTLLAVGLSAGESVAINIVSLTQGGPAGSVCCPGQVVLPEISWQVPLTIKCGCEESPVVLTSSKPWVVIKEPQGFDLQAVVTAANDATVQVWSNLTDHCHC